MLLLSFLAFGVTLIASITVVLTKTLHGRHSMDHAAGVQKIHRDPTPRVGGIAIAVGMLAAFWGSDGEFRDLLFWIILAGVPALGFGLLEDVTKRVSVRSRLLATIASGLIFTSVSGYYVTESGLPFLDPLLAIPVFAILINGMSIGGVANSINIIDGFHGIASGTLVLINACFAVIAWRAGDAVLFQFALVLASVIFGFLLVNFPFGKLFLGDGGAYFAGFLVAALAFALPVRNPEVSPYACLLVVSYPVTETLFSILRRFATRTGRTGEPDAAHLHHIVYRTWSRRLSALLGRTGSANPLTGLFMWFFPLLTLLYISYGTPDTAGSLALFALNIAIYVLSYLGLYRLENRSAHKYPAQ